jgi:hypothetical protein
MVDYIPVNPFFVMLALKRALSWRVSYLFTLPAGAVATAEFAPQPGSFFIVGGFRMGRVRNYLTGADVETINVFAYTEHVQARRSYVFGIDSDTMEGDSAWVEVSSDEPLVITVGNMETFPVTFSVTMQIGILNRSQLDEMTKLWEGWYNLLMSLGEYGLILPLKTESEGEKEKEKEKESVVAFR